MKTIQFKWICIGIITGALQSCTEIKSYKHEAASISGAWDAVGPRAIIYKTHADYDNLVAVTLSDDGTTVVAYPTVEEAAQLASSLPTTLVHGYKSDNRGVIHTKTAFLKLSYAEYAALKTPITAEFLMSQLADKQPFVELCDCGAKGRLEKKDLDILVKTKLKRCKKL